MTVIIRAFEASDIEVVSEIYAEAVLNGTGSYELDPPDLAEMTLRFKALSEAGFPILIAQDDDMILGYAYGGHFRARPAYQWMAEDSIYVAPHAKGNGVGTLLLRELIKRTSALGFRQLLAVIGDGEQNIGSVRLHESLGFSHCGLIKNSGFKHDRWLDTVLMQLELNGGGATKPEKAPFN